MLNVIDIIIIYLILIWCLSCFVKDFDEVFSQQHNSKFIIKNTIFYTAWIIGSKQRQRCCQGILNQSILQFYAGVWQCKRVAGWRLIRRTKLSA